MTALPQRLPVYLGPVVPRWLPATTDDVQALIDSGGMAEGHWIDGKRELKAGDAANKELARDLASFANDGGALLIGVPEDKAAGTFEVAPIELAGLSERVDQVARSRLDPPLFVICHPLLLPADPGQGVLLIEIPASPQAPHQATWEAVYYGRADTTRTRLTDGEIARPHAVRTNRHYTAEQLVEQAKALDLWPASGQAHVFVVVQPQASPPNLLTATLAQPGNLSVVVDAQINAVADSGATFGALSRGVPSPHGVRMQNYYYERPDDTNNDPERYAVVMEIGDDGTVIVFNAGGSVAHAGKKLFGVGNALAQVEIGVRTAAALASTYGYAGSWTVALGVTNLSGTVDMLTSSFMPSPGRPWPRDSSVHIEATSAYTAEMLEQPGEIVRRVTLRLQRGFGVTEYYAQRFPARPSSTQD